MFENTSRFVWQQMPPDHPCVEYIGADSKKDFKTIQDFMFSDSLPEDMSFSLDGNLYHFATKYERCQWVLGFKHGFQVGTDRIIK